MKANLFTVVLLSFAITACASTVRADAIPQPQRQQATATISPTGTPTPDYTVILAQKDRELQDALSAKLLAQADAQNAVATAQAAQVALVQATQTAESLKATQSVDKFNFSLTAQALDMTQSAGIDRATETAREQYADLLDAQARYQAAQNEKQTIWDKRIIAGIIFLALVLFGWFVVWIVRQRDETPAEHDADDPDQVTGAGGVWLHPINIMPGEKSILRRAYVEMGGKPMSFRNMTSMDKETPVYFGRADWENKIRPELLRQSAGGLSYCTESQDGALVWTEQGKRWLFASPIPLPTSQSPNTADLPAETQHSTPPEGGGGGSERIS